MKYREIKDWRKKKEFKDNWNNIKLFNKYIIVVYKVKEVGYEKIFVGIRVNFFLNLMLIINLRFKNFNEF